MGKYSDALNHAFEALVGRKQTFWVCGQNIDHKVPGGWEFQGIFSTEEAAKQACRTPYYFIGPAVLDEELQESTLDEWQGAYYPLTD